MYDRYIMPTYSRLPIALVKGKGVFVWDADRKKYLDFFPGWGVSGLGHCHPVVVNAIKKQAERMLHISNNYLNELQPILARLIIQNSFNGKVFFANSGAEANEGAIKLARYYGKKTGRYEIITMQKSFHGRTIACISATGQKKVKKGFAPLLRGFKHIVFGDIQAVRSAISDKTVAIMLELIQGEGGINVVSRDYVVELRNLCSDKDILLIVDEVQTGIGRTGKMFCYQHFGIKPDIMTLAKSLGSGVPIGALVASKRISDVLCPGTHASTFGGSPLVCAASIATFETIKKGRLLENVRSMGRFLFSELELLKRRFHRYILQVRGIGLMCGIQLSCPGDRIVEECRRKGLLINCTQGNVLRIMPPLIVKKSHIVDAVGILDSVFKQLFSS